MTATTCDHCARAAAGTWCGYLAGCQGCAARSVARSMPAFEAMRTRQTAGLREALAKALPGLPYEQARDLVWQWWRSDRKKTEGPGK